LVPITMTVFDLLLDYVAYVEHSLKAREYGILLSSLVVDRQSRLFLAGKLLKAKEDWRRRQSGFQKYLDRERSSFLKRLSLSPVCGVTETHRLEAVTKEVAEAFEGANDYARRFSRKPRETIRFINYDRLLAMLWLGAWAVYQKALSDNASERFVEYVRTELRNNQNALQRMILYQRKVPPLAREEDLARSYAEGITLRAMAYEMSMIPLVAASH